VGIIWRIHYDVSGAAAFSCPWGNYFIKGVIAAQFRYDKAERSQRITVYEVECKPGIFGEIQSKEQGIVRREIALKGFEFRLWL
jgi:hypothetical protein